jgi:hypothetical protein
VPESVRNHSRNAALSQPRLDAGSSLVSESVRHYPRNAPLPADAGAPALLHSRHASLPVYVARHSSMYPVSGATGLYRGNATVSEPHLSHASLPELWDRGLYAGHSAMCARYAGNTAMHARYAGNTAMHARYAGNSAVHARYAGTPAMHSCYAGDAAMHAPYHAAVPDRDHAAVPDRDHPRMPAVDNNPLHTGDAAMPCACFAWDTAMYAPVDAGVPAVDSDPMHAGNPAMHERDRAVYARHTELSVARHAQLSVVGRC